MRTLDGIISRLVLGPIAPVTLMLVGWWGSLGVFGDGPWIAPSAVGGLLLGLALDFTLLRTWARSLLDLRTPPLAGVALFYSVMIYGFFMGMPVANLIVGIVGGYISGRKAVIGRRRPDAASRDARLVALLATLLLAALCFATAWLALHQPSIDRELRGMLALPFTPTMSMIWALILGGGATLLIAEYYATLATARWAASR